MHRLPDLVGYGLGVAVVPDVFTHKKTAARFVPISAAPTWQVAVATATGRHPGAAAKALLSRRAVRPLRRRRARLPTDSSPNARVHTNT